MAHTKPSAALDEFEHGLKRSKKSLKRMMRRIEGSKARATFADLKAERRESMVVAGAAIDRLIDALRREMRSALSHDDRQSKA